MGFGPVFNPIPGSGSGSAGGSALPVGSFFYWMLAAVDPAGAGTTYLKAGTTIPADAAYDPLRALYGPVLPQSGDFHRPNNGAQTTGEHADDTTAANGLTGTVVGPSNPQNTEVSNGNGNSVRSNTTRTLNITSTDSETAPDHTIVDVWFVAL